MFNLTASIHEETLEELSKMLAEHSRETQGLLARFVELSQKFDSSQIHSGVYAECQEMKTEVHMGLLKCRDKILRFSI